MTEKDFLDNFIDFSLRNGYGSAYNQREIVDKFLETFHKEYFEVEFVKKDIEEIRKIYNDVMKNEEKPLEFKGVPIVWDKVEHNIVSSLHCPARLIPFPMVLDESLPDDRIEIHDQNGEIYVLMNIK
jgi:hypothetical protein